LSPETCRADLKRLINEKKLLHLVGYLHRSNKIVPMHTMKAYGEKQKRICALA